MTTIAQDAPRRNSSQKSVDSNDPIIVAEQPLKRGEIIRVHLELYRGKWACHVRKWYADESGQLQPGKGLSCSPEYLPWLNIAVNDALNVARERGLISMDREGAQ
jgi:Transcriptional Coactivator p15 (PC4)